MSNKIDWGLQLTTFGEHIDSLNTVDSLKVEADKNNRKDKIDSTSDIETVLTKITSEKSEDKEWGETYLKLGTKLDTINTEIDALFEGTLTDETLDEYFKLQGEIYGQEFSTKFSSSSKFPYTGLKGVDTEDVTPITFEGTEYGFDPLDPRKGKGTGKPNVASFPYNTGGTTYTEPERGGPFQGKGTHSGYRKYRLSDEELYLSYAEDIINNPDSSQEMIDSANSFLNYSTKKTNLEKIGGSEIPHYVIPPTQEWYDYTRVSQGRTNVYGHEGLPEKETLWDHEKMRDKDFVAKYGAKGGIFGADPIENYAKDTGATGLVFDEFFDTLPEAYKFAEFVKKDYAKKNKEYEEMQAILFGGKDGTITLEDGTELDLDEFNANIDTLKKLYGEKEGALNLLLDLEKQNK